MTAMRTLSRLQFFGRLMALWACVALAGCSMLTRSSSDAGDQAPLGSVKNPVLCDAVGGEREYLARLRCDDGTAPAFGRVGSLGRGADGHNLDRYLVQCEGEAIVEVMMDLYHYDYREMTPVPGFAIVEELPTVGQTTCPPELPYAEYAFVDVEVAKPARLLNDPPEPAAESAVLVLLEFVIGTDGVAEIDSVRTLKLADERIRESLAVNLLRFRFSPAEHHPGCLVRQRINGVFILDRSLSSGS